MRLTANGCGWAWSRILWALSQDEGSESGGKDEGDSGELHVDIDLPNECVSGPMLGEAWIVIVFGGIKVQPAVSRGALSFCNAPTSRLS